MKRYLIFTLFPLALALLFPLLADELGLSSVELSPTEADAIITAQEAAKAERKAARLAELNEAEVLSEGEGTLPDGRKVIVREVAPPVLPEAPTSIEAAPAALTAEQLSWVEGQAELQQHKVLMLSCTVYDRAITKVSWIHDGEKYLAYANADFNYLRGVMAVKNETDRFDFFMGIGNTSNDQSTQPLPALPTFSSERSEYVLVEGDPANAEATAGLDALLAHYDANLPELKIKHQRSEAIAEAQQRFKANNPEEPEDFLLQFWVPKSKEKSADE